jgi:hypothetical protein
MPGRSNGLLGRTVSFDLEVQSDPAQRAESNLRRNRERAAGRANDLSNRASTTGAPHEEQQIQGACDEGQDPGNRKEDPRGISVAENQHDYDPQNTSIRHGRALPLLSRHRLMQRHVLSA